MMFFSTSKKEVKYVSKEEVAEYIEDFTCGTYNTKLKKNSEMLDITVEMINKIKTVGLEDFLKDPKSLSTVKKRNAFSEHFYVIMKFADIFTKYLVRREVDEYNAQKQRYRDEDEDYDY